MRVLILTLVIGIGATVLMDLWGITRQRLFGIAAPNYGFVGRWIAYMPHGRFRHESISASSPMRGEKIIGWTIHYLTGIAFAALLIGIWGLEWIRNPSLLPAITFGIATVAAPFLIMQPGMGAGFAASRTPRPGAARLQSLITHTIFGFGLYITNWMTHLFYSI